MTLVSVWEMVPRAMEYQYQAIAFLLNVPVWVDAIHHSGRFSP